MAYFGCSACLSLRIRLHANQRNCGVHDRPQGWCPYFSLLQVGSHIPFAADAPVPPYTTIGEPYHTHENATRCRVAALARPSFGHSRFCRSRARTVNEGQSGRCGFSRRREHQQTSCSRTIHNSLFYRASGVLHCSGCSRTMSTGWMMCSALPRWLLHNWACSR